MLNHCHFHATMFFFLHYLIHQHSIYHPQVVKYKVLSHNLAMLKSLPGETFEFQAKIKSNKLGDFDKLYKESLVAIHRAGADFIITYGARDIAKNL